MATYWRRRPTSEAMQYDGDLEVLQAWLAALAPAGAYSTLQNVRAEEFEGGFRVLWDEGYEGAEIMEARGGVADYVMIESGWIKVFTDEEMAAQFEPAMP